MGSRDVANIPEAWPVRDYEIEILLFQSSESGL